jgi:hypothetical protein
VADYRRGAQVDLLGGGAGALGQHPQDFDHDGAVAQGSCGGG